MTETVEVVVGRIGRPHGIRGEVVVELRTDSPEIRFAKGAILRVDQSDRILTVATSRWHGERLLVCFTDSTDRNAAEALRGSVLVAEVPADETPEEEGEYFDRQLVGLRVIDHVGNDVGTVAEVVHLPTQELLVVTAGDVERLIPFVEAIVPVVDLKSGLLRLADVEGLLTDQED